MHSRSYSYAQTLTPFLFFTRERPQGPNRAMKKKRRDDQRSNEHHELISSAESNHESALSPIQIQPAPASPQPSLPPATVQLPLHQHQPAPPINRRLPSILSRSSERSSRIRVHSPSLSLHRLPYPPSRTHHTEATQSATTKPRQRQRPFPLNG